MRTDDLRISRVRPLLAPAILTEEIPLTTRASQCVTTARRTIEAIIDGRDPRLFAVVGPCSIHDSKAAFEYATRLRALADEVAQRIFIVMRVYFEKPRTTIGWKGLINDPDLDGSYHINKGLRTALTLLADIAELGLPAGTEFLDTTLGQFYTDLVSWGRSAHALRRARFTESSRRDFRCPWASRTVPTAMCKLRSTPF